MRRTAVKNDDVTEVFTDLAGIPETHIEASDLDRDLETELTETTAARAVRERNDADLQVVDDLPAEDVTDGTAEVTEQLDEAEPPLVEGAVIFDPKDVQVIVAKSETLTLRETTATQTVTRAKAEMQAANDALEAALEAGDTKANVRATNAFAEARIALVGAEQELRAVGSEKQALAGQAQLLLARAPKDGAGNPIVNEIVRERTAPKPTGSKLFPNFVRHNPWFNDPKHAAARAILAGIDQDLANEKKLDKDKPEYWIELGQRFAKVKPGIFKTPDGKALATGQRQRGAGTPIPSGGGGGPPAKVSEIKLTNDDLKSMRTFGMDPSDMAHRRQWLASKREIAATEQRRAG